MIYLDTSVALASVFNEPRRPDRTFWNGEFVASRLLQYELWNRLHASQAPAHRHARARTVLRRVTYVEMTPDVLARALLPFATPVRTLDSLHLATMIFLVSRGDTISLASYDRRLVMAALAEGVSAVDLGTDIPSSP